MHLICDKPSEVGYKRQHTERLLCTESSQERSHVYHMLPEEKKSGTNTESENGRARSRQSAIMQKGIDHHAGHLLQVITTTVCYIHKHKTCKKKKKRNRRFTNIY